MFYLCTQNKLTFFFSPKMQALSLQNTQPMNYYTAFHHIAKFLPKDCVIVSEGANTMDIGRTMLLNYFPRRRSLTLVSTLFSPQFGLVSSHLLANSPTNQEGWGKHLLPSRSMKPTIPSFQTAPHAASQGSVTHGGKH